IGDVVAAGGSDLALSLLDECSAIAGGERYPVPTAALERSRAVVTQAGSTLTASMLRDLEQGLPIEADQIVGDMLTRAEKHGVSAPLLRIVFIHLKAYEARRARETKPAGVAA